MMPLTDFLDALHGLVADLDGVVNAPAAQAGPAVRKGTNKCP
jgi:hypothetical protein